MAAEARREACGVTRDGLSWRECHQRRLELVWTVGYRRWLQMQDGGRAVSPGSARAGVNVTGGGSSTPELWGSGAYAQAHGCGFFLFRHRSDVLGGTMMARESR